MNRRSFIFGGALIGVAAGAVATMVKASRPEGAIAICEEAHEPIEIYKAQPALSIGNTDQPTRTLVPCAKCGVLFALTYEPKPRKVGSLLAPPNQETHSVKEWTRQ